MKRCSNCEATEDLTSDHIIPKWLVTRCYLFGIRRKKLKGYESFKHNRQVLCKTCNLEKGGLIDYSNPQVRLFMRDLRDDITEKLNEYKPNETT